MKNPLYVEKGIISKSAFELSKEILKRKKSAPNSSYPLTGILFCGKCGRPFKGWTRPKTDKPQYLCTTYTKKGRKYCSQESLDGKKLEKACYDRLVKTVNSWIDQQPVSNCDEKILEYAREEFEKVDGELEKLYDKALMLYVNKDDYSESQYKYMDQQLQLLIKDKEVEREDLFLKMRMVEEKYKNNDIQPYIDELFNLDLNDVEKTRLVFNTFFESIHADGKEIKIKYRFEI